MGSEFVDLYNRKTISYQRISHASDSMGTTYGIFNCESLGPVITLEFGADNSLGTIKVGNNDAIAMDAYLPRVSSSARCNLFVFYLMIGAC